MNGVELTEWVEFKIGKLLMEDVEKSIVSEDSSFDIEKYSEVMYEKHFANAPEINILQVDDNDLKLKFDSDYSVVTDGFSQDSSDDDFRPPSLESIISGLQTRSEEAQIKALDSLQECSAEEMVAQSLWSVIRKILQDLVKTPKSDRLSNRVLEIFRRFLISKDSPKLVCEGFVSLSETISFSIDALNARKIKESEEGFYDFRTGKWMKPDSVRRGNQREMDIEMIFKSMWLLVQSQNGIPQKWFRFNEKRLREIVFSFVHTVSSTKNFKNKDSLSALEILSVLDPKAKWCVNWCHGATGRLLLCSALKTHKRLLKDVVDIVLTRIKNNFIKTEEKNKLKCILPPLKDGGAAGKREEDSKALHKMSRDKNLKENYSARIWSVENASKGNHSAPPFPQNSKIHECFTNGKRPSEWIIKGIKKKTVREAIFCHCLSMVVYLIQYRSGRSLFPLEVTSRRRRITIPDLTTTITGHINNLVFFSEKNNLTTDDYREHMLKLIEILKSIPVKTF